jgi:hypothetical protein
MNDCPAPAAPRDGYLLLDEAWRTLPLSRTPR